MAREPMRKPLFKTLPAILLLSLAIPRLCAQEEPEAEEAETRLEAEFVASDIYRAGSLGIGVWEGLRLDGEYFGNPEFDVGIAGASWMLRWKGLEAGPGFAAGFGGGLETVPVFTFRWNFETKRWFSQGFYGISLNEQLPSQVDDAEEELHHVAILDNNHFSIRFSRFEAGPMWEKIQYREEKEWKGGFRGAVRLGAGFKVILQVVGPETEWRLGAAFEL